MLDSQSRSYNRRHNRDFHKYNAKPAIVPQPGILGNPPADDVKPKWEDKLATLRAQRRAQGLCMKCREKWGRNHTCPDKIALHVLKEFIDVVTNECPTEQDSSDSSDEDEAVFSLSQSAAVGVQGKKTVKLHGIVNSQEILILIDSGSSSSFISESTAHRLHCNITPALNVQVTVASGDKLQSNQQVLYFT